MTMKLHMNDKILVDGIELGVLLFMMGDKNT